MIIFRYIVFSLALWAPLNIWSMGTSDADDNSQQTLSDSEEERSDQSGSSDDEDSDTQESVDSAVASFPDCQVNSNDSVPASTPSSNGTSAPKNEDGWALGVRLDPKQNKKPDAQSGVYLVSHYSVHDTQVTLCSSTNTRVTQSTTRDGGEMSFTVRRNVQPQARSSKRTSKSDHISIIPRRLVFDSSDSDDELETPWPQKKIKRNQGDHSTAQPLDQQPTVNLDEQPQKHDFALSAKRGPFKYVLVVSGTLLAVFLIKHWYEQPPASQNEDEGGHSIDYNEPK